MRKCILFAAAGLMLAVAVRAQDEYRPSESLYPNGAFEHASEVRPGKSFSTIAEAMKLLPAFPKVDQITSEHAKYVADSTLYAPYKLALEQAIAASQAKSIELSVRLDKARQRQAQRGQAAMQQYNRNVEAGLMPSQQEMMQIIMSSGVDLDKASEQELMEIVAGSIAPKWGISKEEYLKIINMAQRNPKQTETYLQTNHPQLYQRLYAANAGGPMTNEVGDDRSEGFAKIGDGIQACTEQLGEVMEDYRRRPISMLAENLRQEWLNSDEARQVDAIEKAKWERVEEWTRGLSVGEYGHADVPYPAWWTAESKKANKLIDQWNRRAAQEWLNYAGEAQQQLKIVFEKAAALEAENEKLAKQGDSENAIYISNQQRLLGLFNMLQTILQPYQDALEFPCIEHLEEDGTAHLGKG
jgi:hypothetical protein